MPFAGWTSTRLSSWFICPRRITETTDSNPCSQQSFSNKDLTLMPNPSNIEREHQKVGETIVLCVRKLLAQSGETDVARVLALGRWHEAAERTVTTALEA